MIKIELTNYHLFGSTTDLMEKLQTKRKKLNVIRNTHWCHPDKRHTGFDPVPSGIPMCSTA